MPKVDGCSVTLQRRFETCWVDGHEPRRAERMNLEDRRNPQVNRVLVALDALFFRIDPICPRRLQAVEFG